MIYFSSSESLFFFFISSWLFLLFFPSFFFNAYSIVFFTSSMQGLWRIFFLLPLLFFWKVFLFCLPSLIIIFSFPLVIFMIMKSLPAFCFLLPLLDNLPNFMYVSPFFFFTISFFFKHSLHCNSSSPFFAKQSTEMQQFLEKSNLV